MDQKETVEVGVFQRNVDKSIYFKISVRSILRPQSLLEGILEYGETKGGDVRGISILAGALAEEVAERLKDNLIEPTEVSKAAVECYKELMAENPALELGGELPRYADQHLGPAGVAKH